MYNMLRVWISNPGSDGTQNIHKRIEDCRKIAEIFM